MALLHATQNIHRYISTAKWPLGQEPAFISNVNTVWPLQPVYPGPDRKNPIITTSTNPVSVLKMEERDYLDPLRTRVNQSLPDAENMGTLEPWARLPAEGFQFHRMDMWPSDSYNIATRVLVTASTFASLALSSHSGVFTVSVTEYRNPNSPAPSDANTNAHGSVSEALGPNGSMALLFEDFLPDGNESNVQRRILTYFWFDRDVFTAEILDAFSTMQRAPRKGPLKLIGMLRDWIWTRCNMNDNQFWCLGTGEQMVFGWCDWNSKTVYTTKRFACDGSAPTLLEMTIYWIVEAFTEHPDLADLHAFTGSTGVKAKCKQVSHITGWMPTIAMDEQVATAAVTARPHIPITNASTTQGRIAAAPPVNRKRRLEEEEECDSYRHCAQRRKFTYSYESASGGHEVSRESSHRGKRTIRSIHKDIHRDLRQAVSHVAVKRRHRPTSRPANKGTSRRYKRWTSRISEQGELKFSFYTSESNSDSGQSSPPAYYSHTMQQQLREAEADDYGLKRGLRRSRIAMATDSQSWSRKRVSFTKKEHPRARKWSSGASTRAVHGGRRKTREVLEQEVELKKVRSFLYHTASTVGPTPRSIPDDEIPSSPDQKAVDEEWKKQEGTQMHVERTRNFVWEQLLFQLPSNRTQRKASAAGSLASATGSLVVATGSLARAHLTPLYPAPQGIFPPQIPLPTPVPSASREGQIENLPAFGTSLNFSPGTPGIAAMLNATDNPASPARFAPATFLASSAPPPANWVNPMSTPMQQASSIQPSALLNPLIRGPPVAAPLSMSLPGQASDLASPTCPAPPTTGLASSMPAPANWTPTNYSNPMPTPMQQASSSQPSASLDPLTRGPPFAAPFFMLPPGQASTSRT